LKDGIVPTEIDSGAIIDGVEVVDFGYKADPGIKITGFIAQDLHAVWPQAVMAGDDDAEVISRVWGVDASKIVPVLVREIQSLRHRTDMLEAA
jgi:hypothetical protein